MTAHPKMKSLQGVYGISYLIQFERDQSGEIRSLIEFCRKFNALTPAFTVNFGISTRQIGNDEQKIDQLTLKSYKIVVTGFLI